MIDNKNNSGMTTDISSLSLALAGAELTSAKIVLICNAKEPGVVHDTVKNWLEEGAEHESKFIVLDRDQVNDVILMHPKLSRLLLSSKIKIKDINEFIVIGKEVCAFDIKGDIYIQRDSAFIKKSNQIIRSLQKVMSLMQVRDEKLKKGKQ